MSPSELLVWCHAADTRVRVRFPRSPSRAPSAGEILNKHSALVPDDTQVTKTFCNVPHFSFTKYTTEVWP